MHKYVTTPESCSSIDAPKIGVAIVGARGYSGLDLARILLKHPFVELKACFSQSSSVAGKSSVDFRLADYLPEMAAAEVPTLPLSELASAIQSLELKTVFLATPAEVSLELASKLIALGVDVIDLSGAYRLKAGEYPTWYAFEHTEAGLLQDAHYGLVPWAAPAKRTSTTGARLVANPGCYATSVLMGILPLLKHKVIRPASLVIDAKSGTTGAGKKAAEALLFSEVEGECLPYKVGKHQHFPEICAYAQAFTGACIDPMFTTHLINVRRGIISSMYARLEPGMDQTAVLKAFEKAYHNYPLVSVEALNEKSSPYALSLKRVAGSARTHIRFKIEGDKLYLFSLIDNLLKGAASQAVENFNRLQDFPVSTALMEQEGSL